jgi:hypothetical protein
VTVGVLTIAAASTLAAAAFAGYATGSVNEVGGVVDNVLQRSEQPPPKKWKGVKRQRAADTGARASGFRSRVGRGSGIAAEPATSSTFERVRRERTAAEAARDAELRARLAQPTERDADPGAESFRSRVQGEETVDVKARDFRRRVEQPRPESKRQAREERPFEQRVKAGG